MRILFLDDQEIRHEFFKHNTNQFASVDYVYTAQECIDRLNTVGTLVDGYTVPVYDLVCLDHDLGNSPRFLLPMTPHSGSDVAVFITDKLPAHKYPKKIIVHSWNTVAAMWMFNYLSRTGIPTVVKRFSI